MNFMSTMKNQGIQLDLKYCERCGGLWLRPQGTNGVYCAICSKHLAAMPKRGEAPPPKTRRRRRKTVVRMDEMASDRELTSFESLRAVEAWV
jgi:uncharacterized Zn finger protein (UPF0148 family)